MTATIQFGSQYKIFPTLSQDENDAPFYAFANEHGIITREHEVNMSIDLAVIYSWFKRKQLTGELEKMIKRKRQGYIVIYEVDSYEPGTIITYLEMVKSDYARLGAAMSVIIDVRQASEYGLPPILMQELRQAMPELKEMDIHPVALIGVNEGTPVGRMATAIEFVENSPRYHFFDDVETAVVWIDQWYVEHNIDRDALFKDLQRKKPALANTKATDADILNNMFSDVIDTDKYLSDTIERLNIENSRFAGLDICTGILKLEGTYLRVQHSRAKNAPPCPLHGSSRPVVRGEEVSRVRQAQNRYQRIEANNRMIAIYTAEKRRLRDMITDLWGVAWEIRSLSAK